jgi:hypothetical protein
VKSTRSENPGMILEIRRRLPCIFFLTAFGGNPLGMTDLPCCGRVVGELHVKRFCTCFYFVCSGEGYIEYTWSKPFYVSN